MAAAAGKNESVSLTLFMDVNDLEVEEDFSTMPTLFWAEGVWMGKRTMQDGPREPIDVRHCQHRYAGQRERRPASNDCRRQRHRTFRLCWRAFCSRFED